MATISIAEALRNLKLLDARIQRVIGEIRAVAAVQQMTDRIGGLRKDEFDRAAQSAWDSYTDLTLRRINLKQAIVESNAATRVTIGGVEMSVAAALEQRKHGIGYKRAMLKTLSAQWDVVSRQIETANTKLRAEIEKQHAETAKTDADLFNQIVLAAFERNSLKLVNPLELANKVAALTKEIEEFDGNFDLAIGSANHATYIDV